MVLGRKTNFYLDKTPKKKHVFVQSVCKVSQKIVFFWFSLDLQSIVFWCFRETSSRFGKVVYENTGKTRGLKQEANS